MAEMQGGIGQAEAHHMAESAAADTAWNGEVDKIELKTPGGLLLGALIQCASARGMQMSEPSIKTIAGSEVCIKAGGRFGRLIQAACAAGLALFHREYLARVRGWDANQQY